MMSTEKAKKMNVELRYQAQEYDLYAVYVDGELFKGDLTRVEARRLKQHLEKPLSEVLNEQDNLSY